jgi:hypothetical protein
MQREENTARARSILIGAVPGAASAEVRIVCVPAGTAGAAGWQAARAAEAARVRAIRLNAGAGIACLSAEVTAEMQRPNA